MHCHWHHAPTFERIGRSPSSQRTYKESASMSPALEGLWLRRWVIKDGSTDYTPWTGGFVWRWSELRPDTIWERTEQDLFHCSTYLVLHRLNQWGKFFDLLLSVNEFLYQHYFSRLPWIIWQLSRWTNPMTSGPSQEWANGDINVEPANPQWFVTSDHRLTGGVLFEGSIRC